MQPFALQEEDEAEDGGGVIQPRAVRLTAARLIRPLQHGPQCPGLSSLFSIVNGIRLALAHKHRFSERELMEMIAAGLRFLNGRVTSERAVTCGMSFGLWLRMAEALVDRTRTRSGVWVALEREYVTSETRESALMVIARAIERGRPLLTLMRGGQYSIIHGVTASSLLLFDSAGAQWISRGSTALHGGARNAKHMLCPRTFLSIRS